MADNRRFSSYGLTGEPESRLGQEFDNVYKNLPANLEKKTSVPVVKVMTEGKPILAQDGGIWYIYIRIGDTRYRTALTAA